MIKQSSKRNMWDIVAAAAVFFAALIVYALTVQRTFSFWDCGEFIASAYVLGIPHPPGSPLYILLGRVFSIIPFVEDICHRINMISVVSSAFTALFSYLFAQKMIAQMFGPTSRWDSAQRHLSRMGSVAASLFVAFSLTNWANSVEAEVYGLSLALMVLIAWLTVLYFEERHTGRSVKYMVMITFLALLGVGLHLTVFLVFPFFALFFILNGEAGPKQYGAISLYVVAELVLIFILSFGPGGLGVFYFISAIMVAGLLYYLRAHIRWLVAIAVGGMSSMIVGFETFIFIAPIALAAIIILALLSTRYRWSLNPAPALAIMIIGLIGFSVHFYLPIRSAQNPSINENNPSKSFQSFVDFLERKQYGSQSMVDRMFKRRGQLTHQFGRHAHMGFWSYFEEQYSPSGWSFLPFLVLGLIGLIVAIRKRLELGLPFMMLFLICSAGLILYMNFADGTLWDARTLDGHMEVRERDYFFTPAFVFFGIAMGIGLTAIGNHLLRRHEGSMRFLISIGVGLLALLPLISLFKNYSVNDRSENRLPYIFAANMLDNCEKDAILFTVGDNETFSLWCIQELYGYRRDVKVVNTALLQGDWYIEQMKNNNNVPMSFTDDQIICYPTEIEPGQIVSRPRKMINDRPRGVQTYLRPYRLGERVVSIPEIVVDDIIVENGWRFPIYFSSTPRGSSPLNLNSRLGSDGTLLRLLQEPQTGINIERSYDLYMNQFLYTSLNDPAVVRDEGTCRDLLMTLGISSTRLYHAMLTSGDTTRARLLLEKLTEVYPEYWQAHLSLAEEYELSGDSAKGIDVLTTLKTTLSEFSAYNPTNLYYRQDLGLIDVEIGKRLQNQEMIESGLAQMMKAFEQKPNDSYMFRKLMVTLSDQKREVESREVILLFGQYKRNLSDPSVRSLFQKASAGL